MESQVKILFVEEAGRGGGGYQSPSPSAPVPSSGSTPRPRKARTKEKEDDEPEEDGKAKEQAAAVKDLGDAVKSAGHVVASFVGFGAVFGTVMRLVTAFNDLFDASNRVSEAFKTQAATAAPAGPPEVDSNVVEPYWMERMWAAQDLGKYREQFSQDVNATPNAPLLGYSPGQQMPGSGPLSVPGRGLAHREMDLSVPSSNPVGGQLISASGEEIGGATTVETLGVTTAGTTEAAAGATEAVAGLGVAASTVALAFGGVVIAAGILAYAVKKAVDALVDVAEDLQGYSPDVAGALARQDVRQTQRTVERSQQLGPELSDFLDVNTRIDDRLFEIGTEIYHTMMMVFEVFEPVVSVALNVSDVFIAFSAEIRSQVEIIKDVAIGNWDEVKEDLAIVAKNAEKSEKALKELLNLEKDKAKREVPDPFLTEFFESLDDVSEVRPEPRAPVEFDEA